MKKSIIIGSLILAALFLSGCGRENPPSQDASKKISFCHFLEGKKECVNKQINIEFPIDTKEKATNLIRQIREKAEVDGKAKCLTASFPKEECWTYTENNLTESNGVSFGYAHQGFININNGNIEEIQEFHTSP